MPVIPVSELAQLEFKRTHSISFVDGRLRFVPVPGAATPPAVPSVYAWMAMGEEQGEDRGDLLYIGKAGSGVAARARQHEGGFIKSSSGRQNAVALGAVLEQGGSVAVLTRVSGTIERFGQVVSAVAIEEEALIAKFQPPLNRAKPPRAIT